MGGLAVRGEEIVRIKELRGRGYSQNYIAKFMRRSPAVIIRAIEGRYDHLIEETRARAGTGTETETETQMTFNGTGTGTNREFSTTTTMKTNAISEILASNLSRETKKFILAELI